MIPTNTSKNQAIIVALFVILVSTVIAPAQMASAKNISKSTLTSALDTTTKIFNIYNTHVLGFNETKGVLKANLSSDQYSLQTILVYPNPLPAKGIILNRL